METIIVLAILGVAAVGVGRSFYKIITGKNGGCSCGSNCNVCSTTKLVTSLDKK